MKIIIMGAGQVGATLAENLCQDHDVTLVDTQLEKLTALEKKLDVSLVHGSGVHPHILDKAGAEDAEMIIAVTSSDECNIVACQIAYCLYKTPTKIARIRGKDLEHYPELFEPGQLNVDVVINPADLVTQRIVKQIHNPGALMVLDFADNQVQILSYRVGFDSPSVGQSIKSLYRFLPDIEFQFVGVLRNQTLFIPDEQTIIEPHDEVILCGKREDNFELLKHLSGHNQRCRRVMLAGGGNIGLGLAKQLEQSCQVKLIDRSADQQMLGQEDLEKTVVLKGDVADSDLLVSEGIDEVDVFCSVTNDDEANIMSAILAKRLGAKTTLALVNRQTYAYLLIERSPDIDIAISPQRITGSLIMKYLRKGDFVNDWSLPRSNSEAIEVVAHGSSSDSHIINVPLDKLKLPKSAVVGALIRNQEIFFPYYQSLRVQEGDHLVIFVADRHDMQAIEKLFQVEPSFI